MRSGYTLIEVAAVFVIVGILTGITAPQVARMRDTLLVEQAARQIAVAHQRARSTAVLRHCAIVLTISADSLTLRPRNDTTALWRENGPGADGVSLAGPPRQVTFSPIGLAMGAANATYTVTRGKARRSVIVSRLGRVRIAS